MEDINKAASRKRTLADIEKLKEKVFREKCNIIKSQVAQDSAYWELMEKMQTLELNHERLQRNMTEVQMQHEAVSAQLQDELRRRPETLNRYGDGFQPKNQEKIKLIKEEETMLHIVSD